MDAELVRRYVYGIRWGTKLSPIYDFHVGGCRPMFCGECGDLIQRYHENVRVARLQFHADCAGAFLRRLFPDLGENTGRHPEVLDDRLHTIETRGESHIHH